MVISPPSGSLSGTENVGMCRGEVAPAHGPAFDRALWAPELLIGTSARFRTRDVLSKVPLGARSERGTRRARIATLLVLDGPEALLPLRVQRRSFLCTSIDFPLTLEYGSDSIRSRFCTLEIAAPEYRPARTPCCPLMRSALYCLLFPHPVRCCRLRRVITSYYSPVTLCHRQHWAHPVPRTRSTRGSSPPHRDPPIGFRIPPLGGSRLTDLKRDIVTLVDTRELSSTGERSRPPPSALIQSTGKRSRDTLLVSA